MAKYVADEKFICSIWPGEMEHIQRFHGPSPRVDPKNGGNGTWYRLKPVPKGAKPFVLRVTDMFEHPKDVLKSAERGRTELESNLITCEEIVADLLRHWIGNMLGLPHGALPGIGEIISEVPKQSELEELKEQQQAFMEYLFMEGERLSRDAGVHHITPTMRVAAEYLDKPRLWSHPGQSLQTTPCFHCRQPIPNDATVCFQCGGRQDNVPTAKSKGVPEPVGAGS